MSWGKLIGTYAVLNGGLYLLNGGLVSLMGAQLSGLEGLAGGVVALVGLFFVLVGLLLMMAGGGIMVHRPWARYAGILLLAFDVVQKAVLLVLVANPVDGVWLLGSATSVLLLVFGDLFGTTMETGLDEDSNVHDIGSLRR